MIDYTDFEKLEIRVGLVKTCEHIQNSRNLYKLTVDCGEQKNRQIITGIRNFYTPDELINQKIIVLTNLKPKIILGFKSEGMLLAADVSNEPILLKLDKNRREKVPPGSKIK
ncbi:MAG: methionine--tRNA ligase [Promethearchaeota archaeon]|nr:MAG: methionine--tRNA ligase [Candidatus Lokiarchaeota archaeon]